MALTDQRKSVRATFTDLGVFTDLRGPWGCFSGLAVREGNLHGIRVPQGSLHGTFPGRTEAFR